MPIDITLNEAEAIVSQAWRTRCGERHGPLEQADVDAIADAAFHTPGVKPTVELIRRIAGGGSPNTIHPKLDAWFRRSREAVGATDVPAELVALWERLQSAAAVAARNDLQPAIDALAADRASLEGDRRRLAADQATLITERATTAALVADLREEFRALQARNDELAVLNTELRQAGQADAIKLSQWHAASEASKAALASAGADKARLEAALAEAMAEGTLHRDERDAAHESLRRAQARIASLEAGVGELEAREHNASQQLVELETVVAQARRQAEQQAAVHRDLEQDLTLARAAAIADQHLRQHLAEDLARERAALAAARDVTQDTKHALATARAQVAAVTAERDHLRTRLEAWASAQTRATPDQTAPDAPREP